MATWLCPQCGGTQQMVKDEKFLICEYCFVKSTLPTTTDDNIVNMFNRANRLRIQGDFDKAIIAYETILNTDDNNAEAHWGLLLSKYGIEYVEDASNGKRVPTCHRASREPIKSSADYKLAIKFAPSEEVRASYERDAARIDATIKRVLAASENAEPYDVFISYKETDANKRRTPDSVLAQEIYDALTREKLRVFISRVSLEGALGRDYEPLIFAAINSARVMIVVGTNVENILSPWVRNEWYRFRLLMRKDPKKHIIPCYKDMDPYDFPEEFSTYQAQDMSKLGYLQDLVRGVKKLLDTKETADKRITSNARRGIATELDKAEVYMSINNYKAAQNTYDTITKNYPSDWRGWWGVIRAATEDLDDLSAIDFAEANIGYVQKSAERSMCDHDADYIRAMEDYDDYALESNTEKQRVRIAKMIRKLETNKAVLRSRCEARIRSIEDEEDPLNDALLKYREAKNSVKLSKSICSVAALLIPFIIVISLIVSAKEPEAVYLYVILVIFCVVVIGFGINDINESTKKIKEVKPIYVNLYNKKSANESKISEYQRIIDRIDEVILILDEFIDDKGYSHAKYTHISQRLHSIEDLDGIWDIK